MFVEATINSSIKFSALLQEIEIHGASLKTFCSCCSAKRRAFALKRRAASGKHQGDVLNLSLSHKDWRCSNPTSNPQIDKYPKKKEIDDIRYIPSLGGTSIRGVNEF